MTAPEKLGFAKLTIVLDKLTDISRGVARLRAAVAHISAADYAAACSGLGLDRGGIDNLHEREVLKALFARVEELVGKTKTETKG